VLKLALKSICSKLKLSTDNKLAIVQYSSTIKIEQGASTNYEEILNAIDGMVQLRTNTHADEGYKTCHQIITTSNAKYNFIIHLTDGSSNGPSDVRKIVNTLKGKNVDILCIGIGSSLNQSEIFDTASPQMAFFIPDVETLNASFSTGSTKYENPPQLEIVFTTPKSVFISVIKSDVQTINGRWFSEHNEKKSFSFGDVRPVNPILELKNLSPDTNYSVYASVQLTNGVTTEESHPLNFKTMHDFIEATFIDDKDALSKKVKSLKEEIQAFSLSKYLTSQNVTMEQLNISVDRMNIVFIGPGAAGKSTLLNSLFAVLANKWYSFRTSMGKTSSGESVSTDLYRGLCPINSTIFFNDIWGWTDVLPYNEPFIDALLDGQLPPGFNFYNLNENVKKAMKQEPNPKPWEEMHSVVLLFPVSKIDFDEEIETLSRWYRYINCIKERRCVILLTKVDIIDERVLKNKALIFQSDIIDNVATQLSQKTGIDIFEIIPFVSYLNEGHFARNKSDVLDYLVLKSIQSAITGAQTYIYNKFIQPYQQKGLSRTQLTNTKEELVMTVKSEKATSYVVLFDGNEEPEAAVDLDATWTLNKARTEIENVLDASFTYLRIVAGISVPVKQKQESVLTMQQIAQPTEGGWKLILRRKVG